MAQQFSIPTVGDLIAGKYRVEQELGRGAYGVVFRADQEELGRHVAVKTLLPQAFLQQDIVQRFHREAQLISRLDHPNIIRLFDYGVDEGLLYMAVEYVEGRTLMDVVEEDAPLEPARVRDICLQILDALVHAHAQGIVHRDLKPENIVLLRTKTADGREYEVVKILDFGISKLLRGENESGALKSLTQDGTVLGTPHYMSPENIVGDPIDHRADLYAFGLILYELLIGAHPFDAPSPSAVMVRHLRDEVPDLPPEVDSTPLGVAIHRSLEKQPWDRIGSAEELIQILEAANISDLPESARRPSQEMRGQPSLSPDETVVDPPQDARTFSFAGGILLVAIAVVSIGYAGWMHLTSNIASQTPVGPRAVQPDKPDKPAVEPPVVAVAPETPDMGEARSAPDAGMGAAMVFPTDADAGSDEPVATKPKPKPKPKPRPDPKKDDPPKVTQVALKITSVPRGATVVIDGVPLGKTPMERKFEIEKPTKVVLRHIGYKEGTVEFTPEESSGPIQVTLEKDHLKLVD